MAKAQLYKIELLPSASSGAKGTYWRGGRQLTVGSPTVVELTKEEVEVYKNDSRVKLSKTNEPSTEAKPAPAVNSGEDSSQDDSSEDDSNDSSEGEDSEDSSEDDSEEDSGSDSEDSSDDSSEDSDESSEDEGEDSEEAPEADTVESLLKDNSRDELNAKAEDLKIQSPEALKDKTEVAQAIVDAQARNSESAGATS